MIDLLKLLTVFACAWGCLGCSPSDQEPSPHFFSDTASVWLRGESSNKWMPAVASSPQFRGDLYDRVAPAVVVVRTRYGFGSGVVVDESGLVLTADHVIAEGWFVDQVRGASYVHVHLGALQDGVMTLCDTSVRGYVVDADQANDLALLRIDEIPADCDPPGVLPLSGRRPVPEDACAMVGHPSSATLWSIRTGIVSGLGRSPRDLVPWLVHGFDLEEQQRQALTKRTELMGTQEIVFTTCGSGYGDSGSPLVNMDGELIGLTCAIPRDEDEQKFTYHIHLQHVEDLLERNLPYDSTNAIIYAPDPYRLLGPWLDLPQSYVMTGSRSQGTEPNQYLLDLDGDSPRSLIERGDFVMLVDNEQFDAEMAIHRLPDRSIVFYDTDNDGTMDEILVYQERATATDRFHLDAGGTWRVDPDLDVPWLDPSLLEEGRLKKELVRIRREVGLKTLARS